MECSAACSTRNGLGGSCEVTHVRICRFQKESSEKEDCNRGNRQSIGGNSPGRIIELEFTRCQRGFEGVRTGEGIDQVAGFLTLFEMTARTNRWRDLRLFPVRLVL